MLRHGGSHDRHDLLLGPVGEHVEADLEVLVALIELLDVAKALLK